MVDPKNNLKDNHFYNTYGKQPSAWSSRRLRYLAVVIVFLSACYWFLASAPADFQSGKIVSIPEGASLTKASEILGQSSIIKSPMLFRLAVRFFDGSTGVKAGDYLFEKRQDVVAVAKRLTEGDRGFAPVITVIPEGTSVKEISEILVEKVPKFDNTEFLKVAIGKEGYLFPDTYKFASDVTPRGALDAMLSNFDEKIQGLSKKIKSFERPLSDVIKMASIVEEEARTTEVRRTIAGILWKRLDIGMPLQVDAAFQYESGKSASLLTTEDLRKDSPYNTYTRKGLPPTPITNPGRDSILATITPIKTPYLYYLTDKDGAMHYAVTHEQHLVNKAKYLK